ncbi:Uncharacterized protein FWK35_00033833, partial [Aphis craccivora]
KEKTWGEIAEQYNSQSPGSLFVTGGGPFKNVSEPSTELESELYRTIQISVEGIDCPFDSNVIKVWPTDENNKSEDLIAEDILQSNTNVIQIPSVSTWTSSDSVKLLRSKPIATELSFCVSPSKKKNSKNTERTTPEFNIPDRNIPESQIPECKILDRSLLESKIPERNTPERNIREFKTPESNITEFKNP